MEYLMSSVSRAGRHGMNLSPHAYGTVVASAAVPTVRMRSLPGGWQVSIEPTTTSATVESLPNQ